MCALISALQNTQGGPSADVWGSVLCSPLLSFRQCRVVHVSSTQGPAGFPQCPPLPELCPGAVLTCLPSLVSLSSVCHLVPRVLKPIVSSIVCCYSVVSGGRVNLALMSHLGQKWRSATSSLNPDSYHKGLFGFPYLSFRNYF